MTLYLLPVSRCDGDAVLYRCRAGWCIHWFDSSKQPATINYINHRTGTTMQFLSKLIGRFSQRLAEDILKSTSESRTILGPRTAAYLSEERQEGLPMGEAILERKEYERLQHIGEAILADLRGTGEQSRVAAQSIIECIQDVRATMKSWNGNGLPATREEFEALCPSAAARENALRAQESAEGARAAAGLPCEGKGFSTDAPVYDADHDLQIMGILGVNAKAGWVLVADLPMEMTEHGHIKSRRLRFKKIVQFDPNDQSSGSFHCYGRLPDPQ